MKKLILLSAFTSLLFFGCSYKESDSTQATTAVNMTEEEIIAKGEYLSLVGGCDHCHTPKKMTPQGPVPDMERWMMGYPADQPLPDMVNPGQWVLMTGELTAAVGPWGVTFAANLTPDETGIGSWTYERFKKSITEGKFKGIDESRPLLPPMPWQSIGQMKDEDLRAIYAYLMSIKPIENVVPAYIPPTEL